MASSTISGKDFKAFLEDPAAWGPKDNETYYVDESLVEVNGKPKDDWGTDTIADGDKVAIKAGRMAAHQNGVHEGTTFLSFYRAWAKSQRTARLVVTIATADKAALADCIKGIKGAKLPAGASGASFLAYLSDTSPKGWGGKDSGIYVDESMVDINGVLTDEWGSETTRADDLIKVKEGYVQGLRDERGNEYDLSFSGHFMRWARAQPVTAVVVEYDTAISGVRALIEAAVLAQGGKVNS